MKKLITICVVVLFCANAYGNVLVYDNAGGQYNIDAALTYMGVTYTESTSITAADLSDGDVLLIPWNLSGDMSGLDASVWGAITGNILLTGQDVDVHAAQGYDSSGDPTSTLAGYAQTFLSQAIDFAGEQGGVGLVALGDYSTAFSYLPAGWGISATGGLVLEDVSSFTAAGTASGVFDGLTPGNLSNWGQSYHTEFDSWGAMFDSFALGNSDEDVVTIGYVVPAPGAILLGGIGVALVGWLRRRRTF